MDAQMRHRRKVVDETMLRKLVVMGFDRETDGTHSNKERVCDCTGNPLKSQVTEANMRQQNG
jgi:hypothetical protein